MYSDFKNNYLFIIPTLGALLSIFIFIAGGQNTLHLWDEGHLIEIISELGLLFGVFSFFYLGVNASAKGIRLWMFFWCILSLLLFGEETSWLQHYIMYEVPERIAAVNTQKEMNLHNLKFLQSYSLIGEDGLSLRNLLTAQNIFQFGFLSYFLIIPIIGKINFIGKYTHTLCIPMPGIKLMIFIWAPIILTIILSIFSLDAPVTKSAMAETREMFYGLAIGMFALTQILNFDTNRQSFE